MNWEHGRELSSMSDGTNSLAFIYDENNIRMYKYVNDDIYTYYYDGDKLMLMTAPDYSMYFFYDADGRPYSCNYNGLQLYYVLNAQGDVVRMVDGNGISYGIYIYDAWGNLLYETNNVYTKNNPLRYRGYVYDEETGLYYCQSRYYDPQTGRFLNADDTAYLGMGDNLASYNLFAYCGNNPVMGYDPTGHFSWNDVFIVATVVTIAALAVIAIVGSGGTAAPAVLAAAGAITGTAVTAGAVTAAATGVAITGVATMGVAATASILEATGNKYGHSKRSNEYSGKSTYNKNGERIDYEYYGNGNGNVHYDGTKGKEIIWRLEDDVGTMYTVSKAVSNIINTPQIQGAIYKAIDIVLSLAGVK